MKHDDTIDVFDTIVLGAGISGLVSASVLTRQGAGRILVVDDYAHLGGNHIDWSHGDYSFDIGSLIFQDDSPLLQHFPELLTLYVPVEPQWARLNPQGRITAYPISIRDDVLRAGPLAMARIGFSLVHARLFRRKMRNAEDFARYWIGAYFLQRSGLRAYMTRFYGREPHLIDLELAMKRMLWISENASFRAILSRLLSRRRPQGPVNRQMVRPKEGFAPLYRLVEQRLRESGVAFCLGKPGRSIEKTDAGFILHVDGHIFHAKHIVSTIPLMRTMELCGLPMTRKLETITLITLYFSFSGRRGFEQSIIYNFSNKSAWKRLTVYSDFYGRAHGREYFAVEVIADVLRGGVEDAERDFRLHCAENGLFDGDLILEGSQKLENAYPIYSEGAARDAAAAIETLSSFGITSFGRQGGFNYQPTARVSTLDAETALNDG
ncbi:NAD(P)-binding protein [Allorhizobium sp. BGMRC 0089]|uniref:NAD(P)-binding protein n=1 Tax=Allorhizobium sonneratiae TaxID=2934936 RepID=UPI002033554A|nr:NAD(P)-binding protein [Allorhizobium sonneratiae]MCM2293295.1 NAD(P)-binding protein [Allorhizobium sonneratiae]